MSTGYDARDIETDLVLLGVRGKALLIMNAQGEFTAVVLDQGDYSRIAQNRNQLRAKTITEAIRLARIAVEEGKV